MGPEPALHIKSGIGRIPALLQEGSVIETAVEITRGEVRRRVFLKFPATSPRGIGKNTDAAALLKEGRTRRHETLCAKPGQISLPRELIV
jgi:hypothetical protein